MCPKLFGRFPICRQAQPEQPAAPQWAYYLMAEGGVAAFNHQSSLEMGVFTVPRTPGPSRGRRCVSLAQVVGNKHTQSQAVLRLRAGPAGDTQALPVCWLPRYSQSTPRWALRPSTEASLSLSPRPQQDDRGRAVFDWQQEGQRRLTFQLGPSNPGPSGFPLHARFLLGSPGLPPLLTSPRQGPGCHWGAGEALTQAGGAAERGQRGPGRPGLAQVWPWS